MKFLEGVEKLVITSDKDCTVYFKHGIEPTNLHSDDGNIMLFVHWFLSSSTDKTWNEYQIAYSNVTEDTAIIDLDKVG